MVSPATTEGVEADVAGKIEDSGKSINAFVFSLVARVFAILEPAAITTGADAATRPAPNKLDTIGFSFTIDFALSTDGADINSDILLPIFARDAGVSDTAFAAPIGFDATAPMTIGVATADMTLPFVDVGTIALATELIIDGLANGIATAAVFVIIFAIFVVSDDEAVFFAAALYPDVIAVIGFATIGVIAAAPVVNDFIGCVTTVFAVDITEPATFDILLKKPIMW